MTQAANDKQQITPMWMQRFSEPPPADAVERMRHRLKTRARRASYGKDKQTVEPVFGIIKAGMRFR